MFIDFIKRTRNLILIGLIIIFIALLSVFFSNINKLNSEIDEAHRRAADTSAETDEDRNYDYIKGKNVAKIKTEYTRLYAGVALLIAISGFVVYVSKEN